MPRSGLAVGQIYAWMDPPDPDGKPNPRRVLEVTSVQDGSAIARVLLWKGRPKMRGQKVMLPDDARYELRDRSVLPQKRGRTVRRKTALHG